MQAGRGCVQAGRKVTALPLSWATALLPRAVAAYPAARLVYLRAALLQPYSATDHTKYGKHAKKCPASAYCTNCMPLKVCKGGRDWWTSLS